MNSSPIARFFVPDPPSAAAEVNSAFTPDGAYGAVARTPSAVFSHMSEHIPEMIKVVSHHVQESGQQKLLSDNITAKHYHLMFVSCRLIHFTPHDMMRNRMQESGQEKRILTNITHDGQNVMHASLGHKSNCDGPMVRNNVIDKCSPQCHDAAFNRQEIQCKHNSIQSFDKGTPTWKLSFDVFCWAKRATSRTADDEGTMRRQPKLNTASTTQNDPKPMSKTTGARAVQALLRTSLVGGVVLSRL